MRDTFENSTVTRLHQQTTAREALPNPSTLFEDTLLVLLTRVEHTTIFHQNLATSYVLGRANPTNVVLCHYQAYECLFLRE